MLLRSLLLNRLTLVLFAALVFAAGCSSSDDEAPADPAPTPANTVVVTGDLTGTVNWTRTNKYLLRGNVFVVGTLNIESGTIILGDVGTNRGTLVVLPGGVINSNGTSTQPVVFTSSKAPGTRNYGDWGGILIIGRAPNNLSAPANIEGGIQRAGANVQWGGPMPGGSAPSATDNSGTIRYTRIEFGGVPVAPNSETNGLTMYAVGNGTTVEFVQVSFIGDDGFEWFGGTVNGRNLISYRSLDDDFDSDNGWSGIVQFGLAIRDNNFADVSGSNGFETDNNSGGTSASPLTTGIFSNMTVIGPGNPTGVNISGDYNAGVHIRRGSRMGLRNSVIAGFRSQIIIEGPGSYLGGTTEPMLTMGESSQVSYQAANYLIRDNIFVNPVVASTTVGNITGWSVTAARVAPYPQLPNSNTTFVPYQTNASLLTALEAMGEGNSVITASTAGMTSPNNNIATAMGLNANVWDLTVTPTLLPIAGSPLLSGASFTGLTTMGGAGVNGNFTSVTYRGAFGTTDWTAGWANWTPQTTVY